MERLVVLILFLEIAGFVCVYVYIYIYVDWAFVSFVFFCRFVQDLFPFSFFFSLSECLNSLRQINKCIQVGGVASRFRNSRLQIYPVAELYRRISHFLFPFYLQPSIR